MVSSFGSLDVLRHLENEKNVRNNVDLHILSINITYKLHAIHSRPDFS